MYTIVNSGPERQRLVPYDFSVPVLFFFFFFYSKVLKKMSFKCCGSALERISFECLRFGMRLSILLLLSFSFDKNCSWKMIENLIRNLKKSVFQLFKQRHPVQGLRIRLYNSTMWFKFRPRFGLAKCSALFGVRFYAVRHQALLKGMNNFHHLKNCGRPLPWTNSWLRYCTRCIINMLNRCGVAASECGDHYILCSVYTYILQRVRVYPFGPVVRWNVSKRTRCAAQRETKNKIKINPPSGTTTPEEDLGMACEHGGLYS